MEQLPKLYTTGQAGEYLGFNKKTARQHVNELWKRGQFPEPYLIMSNGHRFWTEQQLIDYKAQKEGEGK